MNRIPVTQWSREAGRWALAAMAAAAMTAALVLLHADASTSGILYLVLVVWASTLAERSLAIVLAVVLSLCFDYCFLEPRYSIRIAGLHEWLVMIEFVASCIVVSRVADRARRQNRQAEQRREDVERLYALSQEMMLHEDAAGLVREIPRLVERNFALDAVLLYVRGEDQLYASVPSALAAGEAVDFTPEAMRESLRAVSAAWEDNSELPQGYFTMNLVFGMNSVGTLAWKPPTLSRQVATSVAAQVAIAITRAHAIEASAQLEAARAADRLRAALIDSLTHELRTPLTSIRAAASTLVDGHGLDGESRRELAIILDEESARLDSLIGEAMEMAQIESDGVRVRTEPLHIATFLEQAVEQSHDQLSGHRVTLHVQQPDTPVWFDPHVLGRVLRHLLENAARYTPQDSRIQLHCARTPGKIEFRVQDDGPGIDPNDLPHIFDKFFRGRQSANAAKGSGMGLSITRALMASHGGAIDVESAPGHGTTFRFWIPVMDRSPRIPHEEFSGAAQSEP